MTTPSQKIPRVLVTRPQAQAEATAARLQAEGWCDPVLAPVLMIKPLAWEQPAETPGGVVITSQNATPALESLLRTWPVYAVGTATATAAREMGFEAVHDAAGDVIALGRLIRQTHSPQEGALLYLSGATVALDLEAILPAYRILRRVVYAATPIPRLPDGAETATAALLYSTRSATVFARLFPHRNLLLACLSPAVAQAAGPGWDTILTAPDPEEASLLTALRKRLVT